MNCFGVIGKPRKDQSPACWRRALLVAERRVCMARTIGWKAMEQSWQGEVKFIRSMLVAAVKARQAKRRAK